MARTTGELDGVGLAIKTLRTRARWTQSELGDRANLTKAQISDYERGYKIPSLPTLERIMAALEVDLYDLAAELKEGERSVGRIERGSARIDDGSEGTSAIRAAHREVMVAFERFLLEIERSAGGG